MDFDPKAIEAQERSIAKRLVGHGGDAVIVLGASHDLGEMLLKIWVGRVEYERVGTDAYGQVNQSP